MLFTEAQELFEEYMVMLERRPRTIELYRHNLTQIKRFFERMHNGPVAIEDITQNDLEAFMLHTKEDLNYSPNSRSKFFYALRSFYDFLYYKEIVSRNIAAPMKFMKIPKKERNYLTEEEAEMVVNAISPPLVKLVAIFLLNTGLRISECLNLKLEDVDFDKRHIQVIEGKGRKDRTVPMNDRLYELLKDYIDNVREHSDSERFFATKRTGALSYPHVNSTIVAAAKSVGIKKPVSCHVLRHSFASALVKNNVNLVYIQKLLGHDSLAVTSIYTHAKLDDLMGAVNTLNKKEKGYIYDGTSRLQ